MRTKLIVAVVSVCAAAGVVTYDVNYFVGAKPAARTAPGAMAAPGDGSNAIAPTTAGPAGADVSPQDGARPDAAAPARDFDFKSLFDQLATRDAERAAQHDASSPSRAFGDDLDADLLETLQGRTGGATADAWSRLELRGTLVGGERALALVNGRLLAVGDELPGVRWRIDRILADRVIAVTAGGSSRALTLHRFESPNKKTNGDWNAPRANAPASSAETNSSAGAGTNAAAAASTATADAKGDQR